MKGSRAVSAKETDRFLEKGYSLETARDTRIARGKLARAAEPKLVLEWQDGPATDLGFLQQKLRLSFVHGRGQNRLAGGDTRRYIG